MTADALHLFLERYAKLKEDQSLRPGKDILTAEFQVFVRVEMFTCQRIIQEL